MLPACWDSSFIICWGYDFVKQKTNQLFAFCVLHFYILRSWALRSKQDTRVKMLTEIKYMFSPAVVDRWLSNDNITIKILLQVISIVLPACVTDSFRINVGFQLLIFSGDELCQKKFSKYPIAAQTRIILKP